MDPLSLSLSLLLSTNNQTTKYADRKMSSSSVPIRQALNLPLLVVPPLPFDISEEAHGDRRVYLQEVIAGVFRIMDEGLEALEAQQQQQQAEVHHQDRVEEVEVPHRP
jgi:hypothetical protein